MKIDDLRALINMHMDKEEYNDALEIYATLVSEHGSRMTFDDIFKQGLCHLKLDEDAEAIKYFDKALEQEPDNVMALANKGTCLYNMGRTAEAFKAYNRVLKLNPSAFPPWYYIGLHYMKKYSSSGDQDALEKMVNAFRQVLSSTPEVGTYTLYDPVKGIDYMIETFVLIHSDIRELSIDELTALQD